VKSLIAGVAFLVLGVVTGFGARDIANGSLPDFGALGATILGGSNHAGVRPAAQFASALSQIEAAYFDRVSREQLTYAATQGMLEALGDPHTVFLPPDLATRLDERTQGRFVGSGGIGAELGRHELGALIARVFRGGPAARAGLKAGDVIVKVNGEPVSELGKAVDQIRGEEGTYVTLDVLRPTTGETKRYRLKREKVVIQDVYGELLEDGFGYLLLRSFSDTIVPQFDEELQALERQGLRGLIIDVRDNPGGLLERASELVGRFLPGKLVVTLEERRGGRIPIFSPVGFDAGRRYPVVVLVNEGSASAAEIFAGVLRDHHRAVIVGEATYGKASVQSVYHLPDGAQLKVTIGRYYLPGGESVQRIENDWGDVVRGRLKPDIVVENPIGAEQGNLQTDVQLQRALALLKERVGVPAVR
jgi:carboxyl-terminal processing protease